MRISLLLIAEVAAAIIVAVVILHALRIGF